ncbi:hypothetical protein AB0C76_15055 [Kitasatospora sp. NPDC048722]|uniref:hypothetical protein n=1 Tax=Kitasatospora sp. NPDC048722 TaxID=3155639 RepID=UPI0033D5272D
MWQLVVDVLVTVVLTTVEVTALVLAFFAIALKVWAADKAGRGVPRGLKRTGRAVAGTSIVLLLACAYGLLLLHLPVAASAQCLLAAAIPFFGPILTGVNRLREGLARRCPGRQQR